LQRFPEFASIINEVADSLQSTMEATEPFQAADTQPHTATTSTRYASFAPSGRGGLGTLYRSTTSHSIAKRSFKFMNDQASKILTWWQQFQGRGGKSLVGSIIQASSRCLGLERTGAAPVLRHAADSWPRAQGGHYRVITAAKARVTRIGKAGRCCLRCWNT